MVNGKGGNFQYIFGFHTAYLSSRLLSGGLICRGFPGVSTLPRVSRSIPSTPHVRPGEDSDYDTYIYRWFAERPAAALAVSKKMAENAGVDLSDALQLPIRANLKSYQLL